jgi:hypothetical protein
MVVSIESIGFLLKKSSFDSWNHMGVLSLNLSHSTSVIEV